MFNFFNRKTKKHFTEQPKENCGLPIAKEFPPMPEIKENADECPYTVGRTNTGKTVLKIGEGYRMVTVTMNDSATRQLIRMLEATLTDDVKHDTGDE